MRSFVSYFIKKNFERGLPLASPLVVFLSLSVVGLLQLPALFLLKHSFFSVSIISNEVIGLVGTTFLVIWIMKLDVGRIVVLKMPSAKTLLASVVFVLGMVVIIDYCTFASEYFFPLPQSIKESFAKIMATRSTEELIWKIFLLCTLPAICEEIFFRGYCQQSLASRFGAWPAILVTAGIFSALHSNPWYLHLYFLLGIVFGWVYEVTGTLWVPMLCHFINNMWTYGNHFMGFHIPLRGYPLSADIGLVAVGVVFCTLGIWLLIRAKLSKADFS